MSMGFMWLILGFVLLVLELLTGTFILLFFSLGSFAAAIACFLGLSSLLFQILIFSGIGVLSFVILWKKSAKAKLLDESNESPQNSVRIDIGKELILDNEIGPHQEAQIQYQGTVWMAVNESNQVLKAGTKVTIKEIRGVKLLVFRKDE